MEDPSTAREGFPAVMGFAPSAVDLWQWLAIAGGLVLFIEWMIFGRRRIVIRRKSSAGAPAARTQERELVSK